MIKHGVVVCVSEQSLCCEYAGQGDSVVPPTTPDDEAKTRSAAGPVSE